MAHVFCTLNIQLSTKCAPIKIGQHRLPGTEIRLSHDLDTIVSMHFVIKCDTIFILPTKLNLHFYRSSVLFRKLLNNQGGFRVRFGGDFIAILGSVLIDAVAASVAGYLAFTSSPS